MALIQIRKRHAFLTFVCAGFYTGHSQRNEGGDDGTA
jgi:hypothetical protein